MPFDLDWWRNYTHETQKQVKPSLSLFSLHASLRKRMQFCNKKNKTETYSSVASNLWTPLYLKNTDVKLWQALSILNHALHSFHTLYEFFFSHYVSPTWNANLSSIPLIHHCMHIKVNISHQPCTRVPPCSCYIIFIYQCFLMSLETEISNIKCCSVAHFHVWQ